MAPSLKFWMVIVVFCGFFKSSNPNPPFEEKYFIENYSNRIMSSTLKPIQTTQETSTVPPVKFVPLVSLLTNLFKNFFIKTFYGKFAGVNVNQNKRRSDKITGLKNSTFQNQESYSDMENETDFFECDGNHLGLWPDKSNTQRYYKCEIDSRIQTLGNCLDDYFDLEKNDNSTKYVQITKIDGPTSKPCFLLTLMKCANGFKYSHRWRICIPDIVYGSLLDID